MKSETISGTMFVTDQQVNQIKRTKLGWVIRGISNLEFGFFHPWEIGPFKNLNDLGKELIIMNDAGVKNTWPFVFRE